jgi:hypothetical protein
MLADVSRKSFTGNPSDTGAHHLNANHQWKGQERGPQNSVAEGGAGLGVRGNSARIVVSRTSD